jgi:hypothetical protein
MKTNITNKNRIIGAAISAGTFLLMACSAPAQNLFVSNFGTDNIDEFTSGGVHSTFATGLNYPFGIAFDSSGNLYVANTGDNSGYGGGGSIAEITPGGTESTFASEGDPIALAFNSGAICLRQITAAAISMNTHPVVRKASLRRT